MSQPGAGSTRAMPTIDGPGTREGPGAGTDRRPPAQGRAPRPRRFWSARRIPAAIIAALLLAASVALLFDIASVRADQPAQQWRKTLADDLATRPLDSGWTIAGAAVAAVLGLWLVWLACSPGLRAILPMRPPSSGEVKVGLDRNAAEQLLRDAALQISGVGDARATVSRRKATVRVDVRFRDFDEVRDELDEALADSADSLGLDRPLRLTLDARGPGGRR